jgi:hypothetical protein
MDRALGRIHAVTDNFFFWQGLRLVPLGAALIVVGLALSPAVPLPHALRPWLGVPFLVAALWLSTGVLGRYYARNFGRVQIDFARHTKRTTIKWIVVYPAILAAMVVDAIWRPPVLVSAIAFGLALEAFRQSTGGGRFHYVIAAVALGAFSLFPAFGLIQPGIDALAALIVGVGAIYVIGGILDHRELVATLSTMHTETRAGTV